MSNRLARPSRHGSVLLSGVPTLDARRLAPAALVAQRLLSLWREEAAGTATGARTESPPKRLQRR